MKSALPPTSSTSKHLRQHLDDSNIHMSGLKDVAQLREQTSQAREGVLVAVPIRGEGIGLGLGLVVRGVRFMYVLLSFLRIGKMHRAELRLL